MVRSVCTVWFCFLFILLGTSLHVRKNQANLSNDEIDRFVSAVKALKDSGVYDQFVRTHALTFPDLRVGITIVKAECSGPDWYNLPNCIDWAHGGPQFFPWHREFLLRFEQELQKIDPLVTLPYWDWSVDNSTDPTVNHLWSDSFMGGNGNPDEHNFVTNGPFAYWPLKWYEKAEILTRKFSTRGNLPEVSQVNDVMSVFPFDEPPYRGNLSTETTPTFRKAVEGFPRLSNWKISLSGYMHNNVHAWVGGEMLAGTSPDDPVFFLHHCFIDYIWSKWMLLNPNRPAYLPVQGGPPGTNYNDYLSPWDGVYNVESYDYYYQFRDVAPEGTLVPISKLVVPDHELGYLYEGLQSYY